ncbi:MAG: hypothetical protein HEQ34_13575 [Sphingorhabdus sp.]|uniref:hypothetical protein n=1 Tax=Sphingorhabdus sp. TaxID=1902408 RepID=UPI0025CF6EE1|nr:hypothetical protein [Sphingorhabdus sp.]MCO4092964.1 hypothetical protein [Sphingorhabdus sp.]
MSEFNRIFNSENFQQKLTLLNIEAHIRRLNIYIKANWLGLSAVEACALLQSLRQACDDVIADWLPTPAQFVPTKPIKVSPDRAKADGEDIAAVRDWAAAHIVKASPDNDL